MSANIVSVDEESLRKDINNLVRKTVEETLNALLDEETSELVGAERYRRRLTSVEEAIVELYLVGVSTRRIEDVSELLWGGAGVLRHRLQPQRVGLRVHRGLSAEAARWRLSLRYRRRHLPQAQVG